MLTAAPAKAKHDWTRIDENFQQGDYIVEKVFGLHRKQ
jgi:hypothetical protein